MASEQLQLLQLKLEIARYESAKAIAELELARFTRGEAAGSPSTGPAAAVETLKSMERPPATLRDSSARREAETPPNWHARARTASSYQRLAVVGKSQEPDGSVGTATTPKPRLSPRTESPRSSEAAYARRSASSSVAVDQGGHKRARSTSKPASASSSTEREDVDGDNRQGGGDDRDGAGLRGLSSEDLTHRLTACSTLDELCAFLDLTREDVDHFNYIHCSVSLSRLGKFAAAAFESGEPLPPTLNVYLSLFIDRVTPELPNMPVHSLVPMLHGVGTSELVNAAFEGGIMVPTSSFIVALTNELVSRRVDGFRAGDMSVAAFSLVKVQRALRAYDVALQADDVEAFFTQVAERFKADRSLLRSLKDIGAVNLVWALGHAGCLGDDAELIDVLTDELARRGLRGLHASFIVTALEGVQKFGSASQDFCAALSGFIGGFDGNVRNANVCNGIVPCMLRVAGELNLKAVSAKAQQLLRVGLPHFHARALAQALAGVLKLGVRDDAVAEQAIDAFCALDLRADSPLTKPLVGEALPDLLWALASNRVPAGRLFDKVVDYFASLGGLAQLFEPSHVTDVAWACSRAGFTRPDLAHMVAVAFEARAHQFGADGFVALARFAAMRGDDSAASVFATLTAECARRGLESFAPSAVAKMLVAMASSNGRGSDLATLLAGSPAVVQAMGSADAKDLLVALSHLGVNSASTAALDLTCAQLMQLGVDELEAGDLVAALYALVRLGRSDCTLAVKVCHELGKRDWTALADSDLQLAEAAVKARGQSSSGDVGEALRRERERRNV